MAEAPTTAGPATAPSGAGHVRTFLEADAPAVALLCQRVFRGSAAPPPPSLGAAFVETFLRHPWYDPELASRVYVGADGGLRGFIGILPVHMSFHGRPVRAAVAASIMVGDAPGDPLAGARLLRAFLGGPQDLSIGENATDVIRRMWLPFGARTLRERGLEWLRILRPAGYAAHLAGQRLAVLRALHAPGAALDRVLGRALGGPPAAPSAAGEEVAPTGLAEAVRVAAAGFALRPEFDGATLRWLLAQAARKAENGAPVARIVTRRDGATIGGWLAHLCPHGVMRVVQVFAAPRAAEAVVDDLFAEAWRRGAVAVSGRNQPELMEALQLRRSIFRHGRFTLVHARQQDLLDAALQGDAFLNGLVGEAWARLNGDRFE